MATECDIAWTLVGQAAQGARDRELLDVVQRCEGETAIQLKWLQHAHEGGGAAGAGGRVSDRAGARRCCGRSATRCRSASWRWRPGRCWSAASSSAGCQPADGRDVALILHRLRLPAPARVLGVRLPGARRRRRHRRWASWPGPGSRSGSSRLTAPPGVDQRRARPPATRLRREAARPRGRRGDRQAVAPAVLTTAGLRFLHRALPADGRRLGRPSRAWSASSCGPGGRRRRRPGGLLIEIEFAER